MRVCQTYLLDQPTTIRPGEELDTAGSKLFCIAILPTAEGLS